MKGKMIILAAPSGAGKSTFLQKILEERKDLATTVTYTTRAMRSGESEGDPYHFIHRQRFLELQKQDFFIEWAEVHGQLYGTPFHQIEDIWRAGQHVIMDVDVQGSATFKRKFPAALTIFIMPPSIDELRRRIVLRDGKALSDLELRMANAQKEIGRAGEFDTQVNNDDFARSYGQFKKIIEEYLDSH